MSPEELEQRRRSMIEALPLRLRAARWWDIHWLPIAVSAGIYCAAGLLFWFYWGVLR